MKTLKRILIFTIISSIFATSMACKSGCDNDINSGDIDNEQKENIMTVCHEPPSDGTTPTEYTALENISFIMGKLSQQKAYHTDNYSEAVAVANVIVKVNVNQTIYGSKDFKDGVMIFSVLSVSDNTLAPSKSMQRLYHGDKVYVRKGPEKPKKEDWENIDEKWLDEEPEILEKEDYHNKFGVWFNELCDYVITEKTLLTKDAKVTQEGDNYVLEVDISVKENSAEDIDDGAKYYKRCMKTMGDLDGAPNFESATITFKFSEDWKIYTIETVEKYKSKKVVNANCSGKNTIDFSYDDSKINISAYDSYFKQYIEN